MASSIFPRKTGIIRCSAPPTPQSCRGAQICVRFIAPRSPPPMLRSWLDLLLARQLTRSTDLSAQILRLDTSADLPSAYFPRRSS